MFYIFKGIDNYCSILTSIDHLSEEQKATVVKVLDEMPEADIREGYGSSLVFNEITQDIEWIYKEMPLNQAQKLAQMVEDGILTQEQADDILGK